MALHRNPQAAGSTEPRAPDGAVRDRRRPSVGISASDYVAARGLVAAEVHARVDHLEYGGFAPPASDPGFRSFCDAFPGRPAGRHLVTVSLAAELDPASEARRIRADLCGARVEYLVTDFGYWMLGGRKETNLWFRPCRLTRGAAARIAANVHALQDRLGLPLHVENPFVLDAQGPLDLAAFQVELAERGVSLCFDVGHFLAWYHNTGAPLGAALARVPFEAVRMAHVAGLSTVDHAGARLRIDNHNVPPCRDSLALAARVCARSSELRWLVYEAELAPTDVQRAGLDAIRRALA